MTGETAPDDGGDAVRDAGVRTTEGEKAGELLSRLRVIEDQPLEARAESYVQVYDELRTRLEGSDQATSRG